MKHLFSFFAAMFLSLAVMLGSVAVANAELYADAALVQFVNQDGSIVTCSDINGTDITVYIEGEPGDYVDLFEGDIIAILYDDNGTEDIYDDDIVSVRYAGYIW